MPSQLDGFATDLDADDGAVGADLLRQELEAALRPTPDLDHPGTGSNTDLVEEPRRFGRQLHGLSLQALRFVRGVAEEVLIAFRRHPRPPPRRRSYASCAKVRADRDGDRPRDSCRQG